MIGLDLAIGHRVGGSEPERRRALAVATISRHPGGDCQEFREWLGIVAETATADALLGTVLFYFILSTLAGLLYLRLTSPG